MRLLLAPMEGLLDAILREVLTDIGGVDLCVTEFVRVSGTVLPGRTFRRTAPELDNGSMTRAGTPVRVQLLGSDPDCLAANAARLAALKPKGIDLNFGCPAKTVNRHRGGAVLLDEPELMHQIIRSVRAAVPRDISVTAKMRLGNEDRERMLDCALAVEAGGAAELAVHARTKTDGYRPPAYWEEIARIREAVKLAVVANGEIWNREDLARCREQSGCTDFMLGRGMVANPYLAHMIRDPAMALPAWSSLKPALARYWQLVEATIEPRHRAGRLKQWLNYLRGVWPEAEALYQASRRLTKPEEFAAAVLLSS
ncbi:MAG: tRNA-dihydrouridine synthase [Gammaproteobacteria bacterium]|nr:tRNA-dihydrouridine synthase [Gammaproteobacteria bacterium]